MKFTLFKLFALALVATSMASADKPSLRGPVVVISNAVVEGSSNSVDSESNDLLVKKEEKKEAEKEAAEDGVDLPNFFPTDLTKDQIINFKRTAAQKRQEQRDENRSRTNPDRDQEEEDQERARKTEQSRSRGNPDVDPYSGGGNKDYGRNREAKRVARCELDGESCNFSGPQEDCYNDCVGFTNLADEACARRCKYIDTNCYEDCRGDEARIGECLDECEENINGDRSTRRDFGANDDGTDDRP